MLYGSPARAQDPTPPGSDPTPPPASNEPAPPGTEPSPPGNEPAPPGTEGSPAAEAGEKGKLGSISWRDIVTVPRRPILKYHRVEIIPTYNVTINSPVIRHHGFGGVANFFLSETLNIALEATYYQQQLLEHLFLRGLDDRVLPSVNRYRWSATFNFGYVPIYGKFALFNKYIFQWEAYVQAGIGVIQTEWVTRDPANLGATNFNVLWHVDIGTRLFITKWLALQVYLKDYMFVDKFEPTNRPTTSTAIPPESTFVSNFVQNLVFGVGIGMFLPTGFEYKYTR
ncbi:MAG TPA: outer membrane beta-barrel domain-containing protein [Kofleriaceae bacterium]|nr:outer membrane beta-barrel domain-containing protein [Kofleriaceae bacterium]